VRHRDTRYKRPILALNSPLLFAFDGDVFAPGIEVTDNSANCSSNGGPAAPCIADSGDTAD
jgi:hypothetical protein